MERPPVSYTVGQTARDEVRQEAGDEVRQDEVRREAGDEVRLDEGRGGWG